MDLDSDSLQRLLPHRPPILIIERAEGVEPGQRGTGVRRFPEGDPFFAGHFPDGAILPGVYLIDALAQTAMAVFLADPPRAQSGGIGLLARVNEMKFFEPVEPGQTIHFGIEVDKTVGPFAFVNGTATRDGTTIAGGRLTLKIG